jgi:hypothetical protein
MSVVRKAGLENNQTVPISLSIFLWFANIVDTKGDHAPQLTREKHKKCAWEANVDEQICLTFPAHVVDEKLGRIFSPKHPKGHLE